LQGPGLRLDMGIVVLFHVVKHLVVAVLWVVTMGKDRRTGEQKQEVRERKGGRVDHQISNICAP